MTKTGLIQKNWLHAASSRFWPSFILVFLVVLVFNLSAPMTVQNGGISLSGYVFPLLLRIPKGVMKVTGLDALTAWRILAAVGAGLLLGWVLPRFFERLFCFRTTLVQNLLFAVLFIFFWRGYFAYPLADFPALALFVLGLLAYLALTQPGMWRFWQRLFLALVMGVCLAAATLCLWTYGLSLIFLVVLFAGFLFEPRAKRGAAESDPARFGMRNIAIYFMFLGGLAAVLVPQAFPAFVPAASKSPYNIAKSAQIQYFLGMNNQKTEFQALTDGKSATPINIADKQANVVLNESGIKVEEQLTFKRYIRFVRRYPLDIITIYARHLFNGLDVVYPTPYLENANANQVLPRLVNYSLWFLAILAIRKNLRWVREHLEISVILLSLLLPALITIPWTIETRYFLPVFLLLYGTVSYLVVSGDVRQKFMRGLNWRNVIAYVLFIALCFTFSASLFAKAGILLN